MIHYAITFKNFIVSLKDYLNSSILNIPPRGCKKNQHIFMAGLDLLEGDIENVEVS